MGRCNLKALEVVFETLAVLQHSAILGRAAQDSLDLFAPKRL
jgi:hypothetical protein